ncbi:MAG: SPFH domain-containing protein [Eubacteriales bacterium]|jgi:membrane protease subunit (stomatin/prohibitin family)|nr:SPFH domain-containing protein [Clostridiales bacterium]
MGLIKAALGAAGGVLADAWKEFFYCEALPADVLVSKGYKRTSGRSSNTRASDNIISSGSVIAVADGQCMIIVEQGKIVDLCAEPGEYIYDKSSEPSIFTGNLEESVMATFRQIGRRFTFGGDTGKDQRVYYVNTKEIPGNKYGTASPVPFRVVDRNIGLDVDIGLRCNGEYSIKIIDPILFYTNVCGNVDDEFKRTAIESQLRSELLTALQPAFARLSEMGIRYSAIPGHTMELSSALNEILSEKWTKLRGIKIVSFGMNSITASPEDEEMIKQLQKSAVMRDPTMGAATLIGAQADAMRDAAKNPGGAFTGFMGMGMANQAGGASAQTLYAMGAEQAKRLKSSEPDGDGWACSCGAKNKPAAKFCPECGKPKPADGWKCPECGTQNKGKFCTECGTKKPAGAAAYKCDKCGWEPDDPTKPPKFCPECGDAINEDDIV